MKTLFTVVVIVSVFSLGIKVSAQDYNHAIPLQSSEQIGQFLLYYYGTPQEAKAKRIARERYQLLKQVSTRLEFPPLYHSLETGCTALFPIGRSDRVYLDIWGASHWGQAANDVILCYQRKNGRDKLVYSLVLQFVKETARNIRRVNSLLDYIHVVEVMVKAPDGAQYNYSCDAKGSRFALSDLAIQRDYVQYDYTPYTRTLGIWRLSEMENGRLPDEKAIASRVDVDIDPLTNAKIKEDEFYRKYGLPVAKGEF